MDLVRAILLQIEENPEVDKVIYLNIDGYSESEIKYHLILLNEAGLIETRQEKNQAGPRITAKRLTWKSHEFLDAARDQARWEQAKDIVKEKGGSLSFDVFKALLIQLARQAVGLG